MYEAVIRDGWDDLGVAGSWVFTPRVLRDARGAFLEWFRDADVRAAVGYQPEYAQGSWSTSVQRRTHQTVSMAFTRSTRSWASPGPPASPPCFQTGTPPPPRWLRL
jgi:dTDP-4-dehydrorhamnose 3,5-epimerase